MTKNNNNGELQSRREFFKKAAKGVLPIIGAVVLASAPGIVRAADNASLGCTSDACKFTCTGTCKGQCGGKCATSCSAGCAHTSYGR